MYKWIAVLTIAVSSLASEVVFFEPFVDSLKPGWSWIREDPTAWRLRDGALEVRIQPGNMWGPENSGKNVLVRPLPASTQDEVVVSMTVENRPTSQYEQVDLVCYFDDSHMVKIGEELVDGKLSVVMGREEADKTRTIAIIPLPVPRVELKLRIQDKQITGQFRPNGVGEWKTAGSCSLPAPAGTEMKVAIQCYQGPRDAEHWARIQSFSIVREKKDSK